MKIYKIKEGHHYSNFIPCIKLNNKSDYQEEYTITFDESCKYKISEKSCVNKLIGQTYSIFDVHEESDRIGWTYDADTDKIVLWRYAYHYGFLEKKQMTSVTLGVPHHIITKYTIENGLMMINHIIDGAEVDSYSVDNYGRETLFRYTLGFYFGGNTTAPHDMHIIVE